MSTKVQFRWGTRTAIDNIAVANGYIYFATDTQEILLDKGTTRYLMSKGIPATQSFDGLMSSADKTKLDNQASIYVVKGTQTAATASWTGSIPVDQLTDGLTIMYYLPRTSAANATLNLTLSGGTTTGAVNVYYTGDTRMGTQYAAGSTILLTYWSAGSISINGTATNAARWTSADYSATSTDTRVSQVLSSANANYPLLLGYSASTDTTATVTNAANRNNSIYANPSTGTVTATNFVGTVNGHTLGDDFTATDASKLDAIEAQANKGVISLTAGTGLTGNIAAGASGTVKADLVSETKLTNAAAAATETAGRVYPVVVDKNGKLAVNVPWTDTTTGTTANSLTNTRTFSISGGATAAAQNFNGTQNVTLNVTSLDATKLNGTVPLANLPASALERVVTVADDTARKALTTATVQAGDVVKVTSTGRMYFVVDDTKLSQDAGYEEFSAGIASKATYDAADNKIDETYIKSITRNGNTFTATRGDDTTFTFTQTDTDEEVWQVLTSDNNNYPLIFSVANISDTSNVKDQTYRNNSVYVNPSTGTITATNFAGNINGHSVAADVPADAEFTDTVVKPSESTITAVSTTSAVGTSDYYARADHVHNISLATGDANGQVKIAGQNVSVKGLAALAYVASLSKSDIGLGNVDNTADADKVVASADKLTSSVEIDGVKFDGSNSIVHYGVCSTAAATAAKVVTVNASSVYSTVDTGYRIAVKFTATNTAAVGSLTLNVASSGAKPIKYRGGNLPSAGTLAAGRVYEFIYDGTNYELVGDLDTDTTYTNGTGLSLSSNTFSLAASGVTSGNYGPAADVTGTHGTTINVPYITVDTYGRITSISNKVYTSQDNNTTYSVATTSAAGLMSASDKTKLDGLSTLVWEEV